MPTFHYTAKDTSGQEVEGTIEAEDRFDVYRQVRKEGQTIVSVAAGSKAKVNKYLSFQYWASRIGTVSTAQKIMLTRNLATMIEAGLPLSRALDTMRRQASNPVLSRTLGQVESDVKKGLPFNESLRKYPDVFSPLFVSMVKAGEESGSLAESLHAVGKQMDRSYQLQKKIKGAMIYPAIIIIALLIIGMLLMIYVVPTLSDTFEDLGTDLPRSTQFVVSTSNFLANYTVAAIGIILITIGAFISGLRTYRGQRMFEFVLLHIPVIKELVKETNSARTARTFSSLLNSGVEVVSAMRITEEVVQNSYFKDILKEVAEEVQKGSPIARVFGKNEHLYPVLFSEMVAVGEETGKLTSMLEELAEFYEEEVSQKTKDLSTIVEPLLMLFVGGIVGFFAVSMISPIYSLSETI